MLFFSPPFFPLLLLTEAEVTKCEGYLKHQWHPVSAQTCGLHLISYRSCSDEYR